jgi:hypothetical protein
VPSALCRVSFLQGPISCILKRCSNHLSLSNLITLTRSNSL